MSDITITRTNVALPTEAELEPVRKVAISKTTEWRMKNVEKAAAMKEAYRGRQKLADAAYYERNKEKIIARQIAYDKRNYRKVSEYRSAWRDKNADQVRAYLVEWRKSNTDLCRNYHLNRRARVIGNGGTASRGLFKRLMILQKGLCACCRIELKKTKPHCDHIMPLARGGNGFDSNFQLLCAKCNLQKKDRCPVEFMQSKGYLL